MKQTSKRNDTMRIYGSVAVQVTVFAAVVMIFSELIQESISTMMLYLALTLAIWFSYFVLANLLLQTVRINALVNEYLSAITTFSVDGKGFPPKRQYAASEIIDYLEQVYLDDTQGAAIRLKAMRLHTQLVYVRRDHEFLASRIERAIFAGIA